MSLISKYNIPVPRYTSYPTVPFWEKTPTEEEWLSLVKQTFKASNKTEGISLYLHLPFCESLCTYCACNTRITVNHKVEEPYINALLKEWQIYLSHFDEKPNIKEIHLGGGTPTFFSAKNLNYLLTEILKTSTIPQHAEFSFEAHPSNTSEDHLSTLFNLGFKRISFGIQDFDLKVQDAINRFQTFEEVETVVNLARKIGYTSVNFDLVYGLPFQTLEGIVNTITEVIKLKPERIAFYSYAHVPWIKPGQRKFTEMDLPVDTVKRNLYEKGRELFQSNGYHEIGMDHFALENDELFISAKNKTLHRNFMGYTPYHTNLLIALGASSISDSWTGFIQNIKTVEEYQKAIELGHLAIFKGHQLTSEDLVLRKHILNIMCNGFTSWRNKDEQCDEIYFALERLKEMKKDGLVTIEPFELKVTEEGKAFLRNICTCFDARYWAKTPGAKIFSSAV
ncbi:MAG: oxygen-independent coproporphyrinogen III oxidase [Sphingobacteriaceae bacterium]